MDLPTRSSRAVTVFLLLTILIGPAHAGDPITCPHEKAREFDFWIGEWKVNNRFLQGDGSWVDGGSAHARITPVLGGCAILEQWNGELGGRTQIGFSLRAFVPDLGKWKLLLNWPGGGRASFGVLEGVFRHGRGEFFSRSNNQAGQEMLTRYTFSDALPTTMRWDSATSTDQGQTWKTSWIMEFSRTKEASEVSRDLIFEDLPSDEHPRTPLAEQFDFLLGDWQGVEEIRDEGGSWSKRKLTMKSGKILSGYAVITFVDPAEQGDRERQEFMIHSYVTNRNRWESWSFLSDAHTYQKVDGRIRGSSYQQIGRSADGAMTTKVEWQPDGDDTLRYVRSRSEDDGETWEEIRRITWTRVGG